MSKPIQFMLMLAVLGMCILGWSAECQIIGKTACYQNSIKYDDMGKAL